MSPAEIANLSSENILKILRIMKRVMGTLEVDALCRTLAEAIVAEVGNCHHVSVYLLYRHSGVLSEVAIAGENTEEYRSRSEDGRIQSIEQGILGYVARTGEAYMTGDVRKDPYYVCAKSPDMLSELAAPIRVDDEVIGVINVESKQENAFSEAELCLYEVLAHLVGNCISNSVLHEQVKEEEAEIVLAHREAERLERIYRALAGLQADAVLAVAADGRLEALDGDANGVVGPLAAGAQGRPAAGLFEGIPGGTFAAASASTRGGHTTARLRLRDASSPVAGARAALDARILPLQDERGRFCGTLVLLRKSP